MAPTANAIPDGLRRVIEETPWLLSPLALAKHDLGADYLITPHTRLFSDTCLDLAYGKADNCILNAPFRSSKTLTATKYFAAHHLIWHPTAKVATLAYGQQLADEFGWDVREIIRRHGQVMGVRIRRDSSAKANFRIDKWGGDYTAVGRGGALMGKGYSLGIADDLIKDAGEALPSANPSGIGSLARSSAAATPGRRCSSTWSAGASATSPAASWLTRRRPERRGIM